MISIITSFKKFLRDQRTIQLSSLYSWSQNEAFIYAPLNEVGLEDATRPYPNFTFIREVKRGRELGFSTQAVILKDLLQKALPLIKTPIVALVCSDIILPTDFGKAIEELFQKNGKDIFVKGSKNIEKLGGIIDTVESYEKLQKGPQTYTGDPGIYITSKDIWEEIAGAIPEFIFGRVCWDSWLCQYGELNIPKNLSCPSVFHCKHGMEHIKAQEGVWGIDAPSSQHNLKLWEPYRNRHDMKKTESKESSKREKLSIIITGRNDNYDGDFDQRLVIALAKNIRSLPDAEFIYVEWNPYLDRELSSHKVKKVFGDRVKLYVVHPKFHDHYYKNDGFIEYPAKNVGIRRASGDFILCTNSDVILAPNTVSRMNGELKKNVIYRAERIDITPGCLQVAFPLNPKDIVGYNPGVTNACGDYLLLDRGTWFRVTGYCEEFPEQRLHKDSLTVHQLIAEENLPVEFLGHITHWRHKSSWSNGFVPCHRLGDEKWNWRTAGYKRNKPTWGLKSAKEEIRDGVIWLV